ncbi:malonate decarboxylase subunit epsilon [Pandoraea thiooxydans]|uniref:Malonyl CoA-acyl carrier protein transacylase n=1 Tax=Pandoraea thiooxydans TaxID=445709 RepID=A0A0G3EM88_9BURK|nr:malonate decarboxylase subunit epsilon [Pandoraea thiooxydans]AKJ68080.1 malonate decarboxylase subunit epsilon [Pandoraea thiooxydans]
MSIVWTFPGQGAQRAGMLHDLPAHPMIAATLDEASAALGHDVLRLDDAAALRSTVAVQLCLLIAGVAFARLLGHRARPPEMVAGLSIGAYPAAVTAGALDFGDAVRLVALRGRLMEDAYPHGYGMLAIIGLTQPALQPLIDLVNTPATPLFLANLNDLTQLVVAGAQSALQRIDALAREHGARRCEMLQVAVPSHCPLLAEPAAELARAFASVPTHAPHCVYLSSTIARPLWRGDLIAADLAHNMARPVRWRDTIELARERGARLAIEMPGGSVLTRLAAGACCQWNAVSADEHRLDDLVWLSDRESVAN